MKNKGILTIALLLAIPGLFFADDRGDDIKEHLDRKDDRIEDRLDHKGDRVYPHTEHNDDS